MPLRDRKGEKSSGVLMAISSLPSAYGIGSLGIAAYKFVDFLASAGQKCWQILPLNPIGEGNSPYKSISGFGGEILYIDIDFLARDGLLNPEDLPKSRKYTESDYSDAKKIKLPLLKKAAENFNLKSRDFECFLKRNKWVENHALFCAACEYYECELISLPEGIKYQLPQEIENFKTRHEEEIYFHKIMQYIFYCQYFELKRYANKKDIKIIGDIPFYVSDNSVDVWVSPQNFELNRDFSPSLIAGVPPDKFSENGQLWGNPIYDWEYQSADGFSWWLERLRFASRLYDTVRIDHFRAFANFYSIPFNTQAAKCGRWVEGVGIDFWDKAISSVDNLEIIAEDLGGEDDGAVTKLLKQTGFPNMKVMQFEFLKRISEPFSPQDNNYNCVCYSGTHDNDTSLGFYNALTHKKKIIFDKLIGGGNIPVSHKMIRAASKTSARLVIIPVQDLLCLDSGGRMNTPGAKSGNWLWRMPEDALSGKNAEILAALTKR